jgi:hypothetical protein
MGILSIVVLLQPPEAEFFRLAADDFKEQIHEPFVYACPVVVSPVLEPCPLTLRYGQGYRGELDERKFWLVLGRLWRLLYRPRLRRGYRLDALTPRLLF